MKLFIAIAAGVSAIIAIRLSIPKVGLPLLFRCENQQGEGER